MSVPPSDVHPYLPPYVRKAQVIRGSWWNGKGRCASGSASWLWPQGGIGDLGVTGYISRPRVVIQSPRTSFSCICYQFYNTHIHIYIYTYYTYIHNYMCICREPLKKDPPPLTKALPSHTRTHTPHVLHSLPTFTFVLPIWFRTWSYPDLKLFFQFKVYYHLFDVVHPSLLMAWNG